jgi:hypothetical protein
MLAVWVASPQLVGARALQALADAQDVTEDGRLAFERRELLVPVANGEFQLAMVAGLLSREIFDADGNPMQVSDLPLAEATALDSGATRSTAKSTRSAPRPPLASTPRWPTRSPL